MWITAANRTNGIYCIINYVLNESKVHSSSFARSERKKNAYHVMLNMEYAFSISESNLYYSITQAWITMKGRVSKFDKQIHKNIPNMRTSLNEIINRENKREYRSPITYSQYVKFPECVTCCQHFRERETNKKQQQPHFALTITKLTNCCWASRTAGVNRIKRKQKTTSKQNMKCTNRAGLQHVLSLSPSCSVLPLHLHSCSCPHMTLNLTLCNRIAREMSNWIFCCCWCIHLQGGFQKLIDLFW